MVKPDLNMFAALSLDSNPNEDSGYYGDEEASPTEGSVPQSSPNQPLSSHPLSSKLATLDANKDNHELAHAHENADANIFTETTLSPKAIPFDRHRSSFFIPPGKWRDHHKEQIMQHRVETGVLPAHARLGTDEAVIPHGSRQEHFDDEADRRAGHRNMQTKGTIVRHLDLHHFPSGRAPTNQGNVLYASDGSVILEKPRFFLIIGRRNHQVVECPIYTFGGEGLRKRHPSTWPEHCSIRPIHVRKEEFENQSPGRKVLDITWMDWNVPLKDSMVVRLSDLRYRDVASGVQIVASVSRESHEYAAKVAMELLSEAVALVKV